MLSTRICGTSAAPISRQHGVHGLDLRVAVRCAGVDHVQQEVGLGGLGERGAEGGDEVVRQVADEADGVGQHDAGAAVGHVHAAQRRVERGEQLVGGVARARRSAG